MRFLQAELGDHVLGPGKGGRRVADEGVDVVRLRRGDAGVARQRGDHRRDGPAVPEACAVQGHRHQHESVRGDQRQALAAQDLGQAPGGRVRLEGEQDFAGNLARLGRTCRSSDRDRRGSGRLPARRRRRLGKHRLRRLRFGYGWRDRLGALRPLHDLGRSFADGRGLPRARGRLRSVNGRRPLGPGTRPRSVCRRLLLVHGLADGPPGWRIVVFDLFHPLSRRRDQARNDADHARQADHRSAAVTATSVATAPVRAASVGPARSVPGNAAHLRLGGEATEREKRRRCQEATQPSPHEPAERTLHGGTCSRDRCLYSSGGGGKTVDELISRVHAARTSRAAWIPYQRT